MNHYHYVPILKWKQGEYQALFRLREEVKNYIVPLIEIVPVGYDFENQTDRRTIDDHLKDFALRLRAKWRARLCFLDVKLIGYDKCMSDGRNCLGFLLAKAREKGCSVIPVVALSVLEDVAVTAIVESAIKLDRRGVCIRLYLADFDRDNLAGDIQSLMQALNVRWGETDLIVDFESPNYIPYKGFVLFAKQLLGMLPNLNQWRSFTVAGASYPQSVSNIEVDTYASVPRYEWIAYRHLVASLGPTDRIPTFADYAVANSEISELDMRLIRPLAKLRYTIDDAWHIGRGRPVKTEGYEQFRRMCADLASLSYFDGFGYSAGDDYIYECANDVEVTGNLTTWVWVSTNRHLTKVVADLSNLYEP